MERRDYLYITSAGFVSLSLAGCSNDDNNPLGPGTGKSGVTQKKLGTTDITVSQFGFGSHISNKDDDIEREYMIKNAWEQGITVYDVYDNKKRTGQYQQMGGYLSSVTNEVIFSIRYEDYGLDVEEEMAVILDLFGRDHMDMVRLQVYSPENEKWWIWEELFKLKDAGMIRAIGTPIHFPEDLDGLLDVVPLDFVVFPFNFYHNIGWPPDEHPGNFIPLAQKLKDREIGTVVMKPFAGDYYVKTLKDAAHEINPEISFTRAALRYILDSGLEPDTILTAHNYFREFDENIRVFDDPAISDDEKDLLDQVKVVAESAEKAVLPEHYRFLDKWAPHVTG